MRGFGILYPEIPPACSMKDARLIRGRQIRRDLEKPLYSAKRCRFQMSDRLVVQSKNIENSYRSSPNRSQSMNSSLLFVGDSHQPSTDLHRLSMRTNYVEAPDMNVRRRCLFSTPPIQLLAVCSHTFLHIGADTKQMMMDLHSTQSSDENGETRSIICDGQVRCCILHIRK